MTHEQKIIGIIKKVTMSEAGMIFFYVRGYPEPKYAYMARWAIGNHGANFGLYYYWRRQWTFQNVKGAIINPIAGHPVSFEKAAIRKMDWMPIRSQRMKDVLKAAAWPRFQLDH